MNILPLPLGPHLRQLILHILPLPPQKPRPQRHRQPANPLQHRHQLERARLPHLLIRRPLPDRDLELLGHHIHEPGLLHHRLEFLARGQQRHAAGLLHRFLLVAAPGRDGAVRRQGAVVGARVHGDFLAFEVTAGAQVLEGLGEEEGPVAQGAVQDARVHVVEVVEGKGPGLFEVVDLVFDVGGGEAGLDGGQVDAVDLGVC